MTSRPPPTWNYFLLWLVLSSTGWLFSQWIPPMQSPDENQHIARAYLVGRGDWFLQAPPGKMSGGMVDAGLTDFIHQHMRLAGKATTRLSPEEQTHLQALTWQSDGARSHFEMPGTGYYLPLVYLPHALGLQLGERLGLSISVSYQWTRFIVLGSSVALMLWAFSLLRPPSGVLGVLLLPMALFQIVLPTLDGFTTALVLVVLALFARSLEKDLDWKLQAIMNGCLLMVLTSRVHLLPMAALPFVSAWHQRRASDAAWGLAVLVGTFSWLAFAVTSTVDTRIVRAHGTLELIHHYLAEPWDFFSILARTWLDPELRAFYQYSFIGILGWLDAPLVQAFYPWITGGLLLCMVMGTCLPVNRRDVVFRLSLLAVSVLSFLLIFFALLVTWTPHPARVIAGVQGRYFIVPALLLGYVLGGNAPFSPSAALPWIRGAVAAAFGVLSASALAWALQIRYGA